jgi:hypothetical protein
MGARWVSEGAIKLLIGEVAKLNRAQQASSNNNASALLPAPLALRVIDNKGELLLRKLEL